KQSISRKRRQQNGDESPVYNLILDDFIECLHLHQRNVQIDCVQLICDLLRQCSWIHGSSDNNVLEAKIHDWMLPIQADDLWLRREHEATISKIGYDANDRYISIVSCGCAGADLEKARW